MKRAVILTGHFPFQRRRGSILWVSEHLQKTGWHVTHVSVGYSWLSLLKKDRRLKALGYTPKQGRHEPSKTLTTLFGISPVHPVKTRNKTLNRVIGSSMGLFSSYWEPKLATPLSCADLVICESGPSILLAPLLADHAPNAARIYRVNDDIRLLNAPDFLAEAETKYQHYFSRISTASPLLGDRFQHDNVTVDPMGIPLSLVSKNRPSPLQNMHGQKAAVCAGTTQLDHKALEWLASKRPNWQIHVLGRTKTPPTTDHKNLIFHGEVTFEDSLGFVSHADIGLAPYLDVPGIEYQTTNSNRMLLYRHFGLPILGPDRLCDPNIPNIIGYSDPNALGRCETSKRRPESIQDWSVLALALSQNGEIVPPTDVPYVPEMSV